MSALRSSRLRLLTALSLLAPMAICLAIWLPELLHYRVPDLVIRADQVEAARRLPSDKVLDELKTFCFLPRHWTSVPQLVETAEKLLQGRAEIPPYPPTRIGMPFDPADIDRGLPRQQLDKAALVVPEILLDAYEKTGREEFFRAAQNVILGWATYERRAWFPRGYLWNDHALAERVTVLARFWRLYRHRSDYDPHVAQTVFQFAARSGELLARPSHFTFATNHGVMQNLALWHLCLAFPTLSPTQEHKQLALERFRRQMGFYANSEGVVLEHSAHYHKFGMTLVRMAFRYLTLLNEPIPDDWRQKYDAARRFYAQLRRPDDSLPMFGDTDGQANYDEPDLRALDPQVENGTPEPFTLHPVAGYAIWWEGLKTWPDQAKLTQTVAAWSHFPGHGHKHADELSVLLWAAGQTWLTNVGYWPYGVEGRMPTEDWAGSDAPHLVDEWQDSARTSKLRSLGHSTGISAIEMERSGPAAYGARRLLVHLEPAIWIVVDCTDGSERDRTTTTWTTAANVRLHRGKFPGAYILEAPEQRAKLAAFLIHSPNATVRTYRGSLNPFAGWQVIGGVPREASALVVEQPARDSWSVAIWGLSDMDSLSGDFVAAPQIQGSPQGDEWTISLPLKSGLLQVQRQGERITVQRQQDPGRGHTLQLTAPPDVADSVRELQQQFRACAAEYPKFHDLVPFRLRATYVIFFGLVMQEAFFFAYRRWQGTYLTALRILAFFAWTALSVWLFASYFQIA